MSERIRVKVRRQNCTNPNHDGELILRRVIERLNETLGLGEQREVQKTLSEVILPDLIELYSALSPSD